MQTPIDSKHPCNNAPAIMTPCEWQHAQTTKTPADPAPVKRMPRNAQISRNDPLLDPHELH
ncbi:hypothetical protein CERZMDRAFT_91400 [Cercospora zeae-maydis SCOH1-5]|uniref:Uncharacterized protein n=1 Tax=Cercospora zeae-maydis SCOH1-5 TaxID=717836 RepID=A0A6A6F7U2_9PEZI|nr:hypothetical protein CERZMDRAFT_91400 [Cercospora zeae-maydis SCOH1-5]